MVLLPTLTEPALFIRGGRAAIKQRNAPDMRLGASGNSIDIEEETGAGEGIRTLDPDLGKVVLYP